MLQLTPPEVEALLDGPPEAVSRLEIVDCRDEDRNDGWIRGSTHFPSQTQTSATMEAFVDEVISRGKELVVFHCMYSQSRGPRAAQMALSVLQRRGRDTPRVALLSGGWVNFNYIVGKRRPEFVSVPSFR